MTKGKDSKAEDKAPTGGEIVLLLLRLLLGAGHPVLGLLLRAMVCAGIGRDSVCALPSPG